MRRDLLIACALGLLLLAAPVARASEEEDADEGGDDEKDVVVLTSTNWDLVKKAKYALVEFYAPWCGHCKTLKPLYAKAATSLKSYNPDIIIGKVDATENEALAKEFGVSGYPSLKWFVDGEVAMDYNGGRDEEGLVSWVTKKTGPPAQTAADVAALEALEAANTVLVLGFFTAFEGDAFDAFLAVASKAEDVVFAQTTSTEVAAAAGLSAVGSAALIKNFPGSAREVVAFSGEGAEELTAFVKTEKLPLSIEFNPANSEKIFKSGISQQVLLWSKAEDVTAGSELLTLFESVSAKFKGKLVFVTINNEGADHEPVTNFFGLKDAESPVILGFYMDKNKKFKLTGEVTDETLEAFAASLVDGTAVAEFKSAPIPESPADKDGDVQIIVGKTVDSIVKDRTKDVLLEVYAPWCGHCKKLDPIYKKLAKRFAKVDSVVIAKMDGTDNEHPDIEAKGYPTIFFFPAGEGEPFVLEDVERTLSGFTKFLKANAVIPYELSKKGAAEAAPASGSEKDEL